MQCDWVCFAALAYRGWFPPALALILGLLAAVGVCALYWRESVAVPLWRRGILAVVRVLLLASILFLALRPTIVTESKQDRPRAVAVLVDDSQSMTNRDPRPNFLDQFRAGIALGLIDPTARVPEHPSAGDLPRLPEQPPSRLELAQAVLRNPQLQLLDQLRAIGPVQPSSFGRRRVGRDGRSTDWIAALQGQEPTTALADSVFDLLNRDSTDLPAAIVLLTDGRDNASERSWDDLSRVCLRRGVPLHIYGVGSSAFGQLQLRDVAVNATLFVEDTAAIPIRYRVRGFTEGQVILTAKLNGIEVARKKVPVREGEDLRETLSFVPTPRDAEIGKQELTTTVTIVSGPDSVTDTLAKSVRVIDRKIKTLVVDSAPRWDFKFLQRALLRDRRMEARFFLTEGDPKAMQAGEPFLAEFPTRREELFAYDLLILGDIPATALQLEQQEFVRDFVAEGGGLIVLAGRNHGPSSWLGTPLAEVLPIEYPAATFAVDAGRSAASFRPVLTPAGKRNPVLSLDDNPTESARIWETLPEMFWSYPVTKLKPAAEAYLVHPTARTVDEKPMPLLASHYYGKGYVLYLGCDETWRWRFNEAEKYFGRFWTQVVYITGVPRTLGTKLTQLSLDTTDPLLGKTGQVYARLFTPSMQPLTTERMDARLERLDVAPGDKDRSAPVELKAVPGQPGEYVATLPFNALGRYVLRVENGSDPASLEYRVTLPPDHEMAPGSMAEEALRTLAKNSGGKFYREEDLHTLPGSLVPQFSPYSRREELLLWNRWMLFWVIGLFSAEWFLRKLNALS
ncbi:MAG: hypothetical protein LC104_01740 [Bacteroidales bacterium]|nr:hypothetical protein [Bacteroidales bacterium]